MNAVHYYGYDYPRFKPKKSPPPHLYVIVDKFIALPKLLHLCFLQVSFQGNDSECMCKVLMCRFRPRHGKYTCASTFDVRLQQLGHSRCLTKPHPLWIIRTLNGRKMWKKSVPSHIHEHLYIVRVIIVLFCMFD